MRRPAGFTLIELLTVIGIIVILAGLILPVFASARGKARELSCISNLRQIGLGIRMYSQDYDELYPWAVDPTDRYTPAIWSLYPEFQAQIPFMPFMHEVLQPYIRSKELFHCPSDTGYTVEDFNGMPLDATPASFTRFGTSYNFRTEIAFRRAGEPSFRNPVELNVMFDASGSWHGGVLFDRKRYNVLHGDGHVKNLQRDQVLRLWSLPVI